MISEIQFEVMKKHRQLFLETGEIHNDVQTIVADSWKRSMSYGVEADVKGGKSNNSKYFSNNEVKKLLEENKQLLDVAYPIMLRSVDYIEGTQYAITLHDKFGRIIYHLFAGDNHKFYSSSVGFNMGASWDEKSIGTCAPSLSIMLDRDIQLIGPEHFNAELCNLACTAAPIHSKSGEVIACINVLGDYKKLTPHTMVFIKAISLLIQSNLMLKDKKLLVEKTFESLTDGIIVLDKDYRVRQASMKAASILQIPYKSICSLDFREIFKKEDLEDRLLCETQPFAYSEYELIVGENNILCNVQITPMNDGDMNEGVIITLNKTRNTNKIVNQISRNNSSYSFDDIISQDSSISAIKKMMKNVASTDHCILIEGESGTGKELFAHALHNESNRRMGPFIVVNCGSLPRSLVESELFGYEKGAFTGARSGGSPGKFELADGGTIFLDEIGELPLEIQATLLRVLDNHCVMRIGGKTEKKLDIRIIAATNRDLYREVKNGNFRSDLFFRINVLKYDIPPLRDRGEDVVILSEMFLAEINDNLDQGTKSFSEDFYEMLRKHSWTGNVRELHNVVARGFYSTMNPVITAKELPNYILDEVKEKNANYSLPVEAKTHNSEIEEFEKQQIIEALRKCNGNAVLAGKMLGYSKSTIYRRIRGYNIKNDL